MLLQIWFLHQYARKDCFFDQSVGLMEQSTKWFYIRNSFNSLQFCVANSVLRARCIYIILETFTNFCQNARTICSSHVQLFLNRCTIHPFFACAYLYKECLPSLIAYLRLSHYVDNGSPIRLLQLYGNRTIYASRMTYNVLSLLEDYIALAVRKCHV